MQLDDLKNTWEREITMDNKIPEFGAIRRRADKLDRLANFVWSLELLTCAGLVIFILLRWLVWPPDDELSPLLQLGFLSMVVAGVFVGAKIAVSRRVLTNNDWTLSSKINIQIEKREQDLKLLNTIASWYLTPLFIAVILASYGGYVQRTGGYIPDPGLLIYWAVCVAGYIVIYLRTQNRIKTKIQPVLDQLYDIKRKLES